MKQQINEIKRMQHLAGIISESQLNEAELGSNEQELVDAVLAGEVNEAIDLGKILEKVKALANKGLLTVAMASTILASCGTAGSSDEIFKRELENLKKVDSIENVQKARIDSISQAIRSNPTTATVK
jgi:tRNA(Ser,Leu) C12 N-acetylase TAN1